jgi:predicted nucleic acid-binding protein
MPFGLLEARRHAQLWAELTRKGKMIGAHDLIIAATALAHDFHLATLNATEFRRVPGLKLVTGA